MTCGHLNKNTKGQNTQTMASVVPEPHVQVGMGAGGPRISREVRALGHKVYISALPF